MELIEKEKKEFVRVLIGKAKSGKSGLQKPITTIRIDGASVDEVVKVFKDAVKAKSK